MLNILFLIEFNFYVFLVIFLLLFLVFEIIMIIRKILFRRLDKKLENAYYHFAGFTYDGFQDIYYSEKNAWQKKYGYKSSYDLLAPTLSLTFDAEPIKFNYNNKAWLIELWKGQYGMSTGCEIGVYNTSIRKSRKKNAKYKSVNDSEYLEMSFKLIKNNRVEFERCGRHWWLTGFRVGEFSYPQELSMRIRIKFLDNEMSAAFREAMINLGYTSDNFYIDNNIAYIYFDKPYTNPPISCNTLMDSANLSKNKILCDTFMNLTKGIYGTPNKLKAIQHVDLRLLKNIMGSFSLLSYHQRKRLF